MQVIVQLAHLVLGMRSLGLVRGQRMRMMCTVVFHDLANPVAGKLLRAHLPSEKLGDVYAFFKVMLTGTRFASGACVREGSAQTGRVVSKVLYSPMLSIAEASTEATGKWFLPIRCFRKGVEATRWR